MKRLILASLLATGLMGAGGTHADTVSVNRDLATRLMNELMSGTSDIGGPFTLTDQFGKKRHSADFKGKIVLLYFGYISCPDVCPTDLLAIREAMALLGNDEEEVQPVFITLDPQRDTQPVIAEYVANFHPRFVGLRGSEKETRKIATQYKTFYQKVVTPGSDFYSIDHSAQIFLLDRNGKYVSFFPPGTIPARMVTMIKEQIHGEDTY